MLMQYCDVTNRLIRVICFVRPCVDSMRRLVPFQLEYFDYSIPDRLTPVRLFHWHAFNVLGIYTVYSADDIAQFFDIAHDVASTSCPTVQKSFSTPAAIAGVQRSVL